MYNQGHRVNEYYFVPFSGKETECHGGREEGKPCSCHQRAEAAASELPGL